jgi:hypothetical protein
MNFPKISVRTQEFNKVDYYLLRLPVPIDFILMEFVVGNEEILVIVVVSLTGIV